MAFPTLYTYPSSSLFPGTGPAWEGLSWDKPNERYFQHGLDRGVLFPTGGVPVPWMGLTGVNESSDSSSTISYIDGRVFLAQVTPGDFKGSLSAYFWPEEFSACVGMPQVADGFILDNQRPKRFGLSYRTLIGSGTEGDMFGYQIHLLYNVMASIGQVGRKTLNESPSPVEFNFDLVATPVKLPGYRPTAHYIIDTRNLDPDTIKEIENILYGSIDGPVGRLPEPVELFDMLNFGDSIDVTVNSDGTYVVKGRRSNVFLTNSTTYEIDNINAVDNGDGTYTISDGGDTTVTVA